MVRSGIGPKSYLADSAKYKLLEEVGNGASATVYRAIYLPFNEVVAVKCLDLERCNSNLDDIMREAQTMSLINHPNVIRAYCSFVVERHLWVVMPFMDQGSCLHLMKIAHPDGFDEPYICTILKETLKAIEYLHKQEHIHRDIKAGNILFDSNGFIKLADFGVTACMFEKGDRKRSRNTIVGTPCWMAPEVLQPDSGYDVKADIWSFGITALELAHGHAPFSKYPPMKVLLMTIQNAPPGLDYDRDKKFSKIRIVATVISETRSWNKLEHNVYGSLLRDKIDDMAFKEMVAMCLVKDQKKRPTAEKLLKHSFFKHAKPPGLSVKKLFADLPPLWERVKALQQKDAASLALKRMPSAEEEALSQSEYKRGVSAWNFDIEDLKEQASLIEDDDELAEIREGDESVKSTSSYKDTSDAGSCPDKGFFNDENVSREQLNSNGIMQTKVSGNKGKSVATELPYPESQEKNVELQNGSSAELGSMIIEETGQMMNKPQSAKGRLAQSGPLIPGIGFGTASSEKNSGLERSENGSSPATGKVTSDILRAASFSGPLMLPNRASANSLSAPIKSSPGFKDSLDDKAKANLVQVKGRFSVTSENLDLVNDISCSTASRRPQGLPLKKSASVGDWNSDGKQMPPDQLSKDLCDGSLPVSLLLHHLQNLFQQTSIQQDFIMKLLTNLQPTDAHDAPLNGKTTTITVPHSSENGNIGAESSEREHLLMKISELQARMDNLTEELNAERQKHHQLQQQLAAFSVQEEDDEKAEMFA